MFNDKELYKHTKEELIGIIKFLLIEQSTKIEDLASTFYEYEEALKTAGVIDEDII